MLANDISTELARTILETTADEYVHTIKVGTSTGGEADAAEYEYIHVAVLDRGRAVFLYDGAEDASAAEMSQSWAETMVTSIVEKLTNEWHRDDPVPVEYEPASGLDTYDLEATAGVDLAIRHNGR